MAAAVIRRRTVWNENRIIMSPEKYLSIECLLLRGPARSTADHGGIIPSDASRSIMSLMKSESAF
jgi:hypothetical protein